MSAVRFRYPAQKFTKINTMEKIKLLRPLWNRKAGETMEVTKDAAAFALRKKYAEPISEQIESIKPQFAPQNKAELKPRKNKRNAD